MSRRSRQQSVPDWPKSLALPVVQGVVIEAPPPPSSNGLTLTAAHKGEPGDVFTNAPKSAIITAFFFGLTRNGQHLAAELQVEGTRVVGLAPLCLSPHADVSGRIWESLAFYRLCHGREYTATEREANARQGGKVALEDIAEGHAVALVQRSGKTVALAMEVEGAKVTEPKVLGTGNRLYAWQEAHAYAQRWFLPKRRKG